jgi:hypothetical protein
VPENFIPVGRRKWIKECSGEEFSAFWNLIFERQFLRRRINRVILRRFFSVSFAPLPLQRLQHAKNRCNLESWNFGSQRYPGTYTQNFSLNSNQGLNGGIWVLFSKFHRITNLRALLEASAKLDILRISKITVWSEHSIQISTVSIEIWKFCSANSIE